MPALLYHVLTAIVFAIAGVVVFVVSFCLVDWWLPADLWKEIIEGKNMALAIVVGLTSLGICIIIAASVHG